ncbi:MAG: sigma-70 family RNA polymerase sigma factor [Clostridia bacterium]|nr:sigma-70 family RNA polymerase sigma factor [Clostridia bacterium]
MGVKVEKVVICGVDTSKLPKLSYQESNQLLKKAQAGDSDARDYFITCNLRLVLSLVKRYQNRSVDTEDLFQAGCIGLIKSVDNFNLNLNVKFSTYAVPMIVGEIRRIIRESNSMRVSRGIRDVAYSALQVREQLEQATNKTVTMDQIAKELNLPVYRVVYCLDAIADTKSLQETVYSTESDEICLEEQLSNDKDEEVCVIDNISLKKALKKLPKREQDIVLKRYYEGKTQTEVSFEVGISQAQVSRLEKNAVSEMYTFMS